MIDYDRMKARRQVEMDDELLRRLHAESQRMHHKLKLLQGEIAGAREAIAEKERQIGSAEERAGSLQSTIARIERQEAALHAELQGWQDQLAM